MRSGITALVWLITTAILSAQSVPRVPDIGERASEASVIVVATVVDVTGRFGTNAHGDRLIYSDVLLAVADTLKGARSQSLTMTIEGGEVGDLKLQVTDMPTVRHGDRGLYFLDRSPRGEWVPHRRGLGILKILAGERVENSDLTLTQATALVRRALR